MTDKLAITWRYIEDSETQNELLRSNIEQSDDYYFGRLPGNAPAGRSQSVSLDVQSMITAVLASTISGFTNEQPAHFLPIGDDDDIQAELESMAVAQVIEDSGGYQALHGAVESALRYKNGVMRVWVNTSKVEEKRELPDATAQELAQVLASIPDEFSPIIKGDTVAWSREVQTVEVETIDIARLRYPKDHAEMNFQTMPFVAIQQRDLRKDLIEMGFPKDIVNTLPKTENANTADGAIRSKLLGEERSYNDAPVEELDYVEWFECWVQIPDSGGSTHLERIATSNRKMLDNTPATHVPLAPGAAFPQAHRFQGISLFDKLKMVQVSKTEAQRQYEDNLAGNNSPRSLTWGVNTDDALNGRVDGIVRATEPGARFEPIVVQDLTAGSLAYLAYMDNVRGELGGSALAMQAPESELMKSQIGAVSSAQLIQAQEQISAYISKNLGETLIRSLYLLTHRVLREDFSGQLLIRRADQAQPVSPREWQPRTRVALTSGMSPSERNRKAANLMQVVQTQMGMLQAGMTLASPDGLHAALRDWGYASDLPMNSYLTDPQSPKGQQLAQAQQQQAQQQKQQQDGLMQFQMQLENMKLQMEKYNTDMKAMVDWRKAVLQSEVDEAGLVLQGITDAETAELNRTQAISPTTGNGAGTSGSGT